MLRGVVWLLWIVSLAAAGPIGKGPAWMNNLRDAEEIALKEQKPIVLFLHSRRCFYCPKLIEEVFPDPKLREFLEKHFILLSLDTSTGSDSIEEETADQAPERFLVTMTPAFVFMGPREEKLYRKGKKHMIVYGFWSAAELIRWGQEALKRFDKLYGDRYERR
ncbi:thioredoxin family protein [Nitratifractor sp.]